MFNRNKYPLLTLWHLVILPLLLVSGVVSAKVVDVSSPKAISHLVASPKVPLAFVEAVEYILPAGWKVVCSKNDNRCQAVAEEEARIYWKKSEDWKFLLDMISSRSGHDFYVDWNTKTLGFSRESLSASTLVTQAVVKPKLVVKKPVVKPKVVIAKAESDTSNVNKDIAAAAAAAAAVAKLVGGISNKSKPKPVTEAKPVVKAKPVVNTISEKPAPEVVRYAYTMNGKASLREAASDMADAWEFNGVMYSLGSLDINQPAKKPYTVSTNSLDQVATQINSAYNLELPIHLYKAQSGELVMAAHAYNNPDSVRIFNVKQDTLLSNIQRLAQIYGWRVIEKSWPYDFHFKEQYSYPVVIDSFDTGLNVLLQRYPVQAQLIDNAKQVIFVSRPLPIQGAN